MNTFNPGWPWRNRHLQSIFPSLLLRGSAKLRSRPLRSASRELLLDCGDDVKLQALHSPPPNPSGVLAVLLHGWEGSSEAYYMLSLGQALFDAGVEVVRLNLRDHGQTHHLNPEIFHSCRLPEVCGAVGDIQSRLPGRETWLIGFSLGGNFMLRVASSQDPRVGRLRGVIAVSPVLDPATTLTALEKEWSVYHRYFVHKWTRSLRRKQKLWPGHLDFSDMLHLADLRRMTATLVARHTEYPTMQDYLDGYAITGDRLATLSAPATILASDDDPIIPAGDLARLAPHPDLKVIRHSRGGHMGFMESPFAPSWLNGFIVRQLGV